jgi:hypothetical protein
MYISYGASLNFEADEEAELYSRKMTVMKKVHFGFKLTSIEFSLFLFVFLIKIHN